MDILVDDEFFGFGPLRSFFLYKHGTPFLAHKVQHLYNPSLWHLRFRNVHRSQTLRKLDESGSGETQSGLGVVTISGLPKPLVGEAPLSSALPG